MPAAKATLHDYLLLLRWHRMVGAWLLFWPCAWGILCATPLRDANTLWILTLHAVGAVLLRSAGCVINDIFDRHLDAQVARTKNRPLARGGISVPQALLVLTGLCMAGLLVALLLPWRTLLWGLLAMPLVVMYPLAKRYVRAPQVVLGIVFSWGAWVGSSAVSSDGWHSAWLPYLAAVLCTIGYDTIYALPDAADDAAQGMYSTPLLWGAHSPYWIAACYAGTIALWALMGAWYAPHLYFWFGWSIASGVLIYSVFCLSRKSTELCDKLFYAAHYAMGIVALGLW